MGRVDFVGRLLASQFLITTSVASAACPATAADLLASVSRAERAFEVMDGDALRAADDEIDSEAGCLGESVDSPTVARVHRVRGLRAYLDGKPDDAAPAFAAARALDPTLRFDARAVPPEHPLREVYARIDPATLGFAALETPASGRLQFDGLIEGKRPEGRPSLALLLSPDGAVIHSDYLLRAEPMFDYEVRAAPPRRSRAPALLAGAAGVSALAAGATWAVAKGAHDAYYGDSVARDDLEPLRDKTNTWFFTSVGFGAVAAGAGIAAAVAWSW